jgi:2-polyprenyl-3-methyl-5-hydroxy-6-metoxy-1,4-benzoquinol methylase
LAVAGCVVRYLPKESVIIDCGCGWGQVGKILLECGYKEFYGFDISATKVDVCRHIGLEVLKSSIDKIPWSSDYADGVICSEVLEHLPPAVFCKAVSEIERIVKREGTIIITTPQGSTALSGPEHKRVVYEEDILRRLPGYKVVEKKSVFGRYESRHSTSNFLVLQERNNG